jgi:hypothetical protein
MDMLQDFEIKLREVLKNHDKPRPFVCNGNPLDCQIFIVGFNAATEMNASFWDFWSSDSGFNKPEWLKTYTSERAAKPLKPGKTRRNKISATRQRIEWITESAFPAKCLETNLYSKATVAAKDLKKNQQDTSAFTFLLQSIRPKVVFLHGADTRKDFGEMLKQAIPEDQPVEMDVFGAPTIVIAERHLSRGWSREKAESFGKELLTYL